MRILIITLQLVIFFSCTSIKNVNFSNEYKKEYQGKTGVYVPEVHELANIAVAISKAGRLDSNMTDMTTDYYQKVITRFDSYSHHPLIEEINKHITKPMDINSYWYYYSLKMNACGYMFLKNETIVNSGPIKKMGFNSQIDPIKKNKSLFEDFAKKTRFRDFYYQNRSYYQDLTDTYIELNPIDTMQHWLEKRFGFEYGNYSVYFSPLVGGAHATNRFSDSNFKQSVMFVCRATYSDQYNQNVNEMLQSRVVFTEIDHNFVNPISDRVTRRIKHAFSNRTVWVAESQTNGVSMYSNEYSVFNEYMTWALFSLYCVDRFTSKDVNVFLPIMENQMIHQRGFIKFDRFNQQLISIYKNNKTLTIQELFDKILMWSEDINSQ